MENIKRRNACRDSFPTRSKMKSGSVALTIGVAAVLVVALLPACAKQYVHVPQTVGPAPEVLHSPNAGTLVVTTEQYTSGDEEFPHYEPYAVLDHAGRLVKRVDNASGADAISLEAGRYSLRVQTLRRRVIGIDVQVVAGKTTEVHCEGDWVPNPSVSTTLVKGPEGSPIGYRSVPAASPPPAEQSPRTRDPGRAAKQ